jgi:hypothetical protein
VIVFAANVALFRHDVHFDVSREGRNTPPAQLTTVVDTLRVLRGQPPDKNNILRQIEADWVAKMSEYA